MEPIEHLEHDVFYTLFKRPLMILEIDVLY